MTKAYDIHIDYLEHDGGTKFYETVRIFERIKGATSTASSAMLIQRWGKIEQNTGGGQTKVTIGAGRTIEAACVKVLTEKKTYRSGKGQYKDATMPHFGLGRGGSTTSIGNAPDRMMHMVAEHYPSAVENQIRNFFALAGESGEDVADDVVIEGMEENEIDRGTNWASW